MRIGEVAAETGLSVKAIRYYEQVGLIYSKRDDNRYRIYEQQALQQLRFIKTARELGFTVEECQQLLRLWSDQNRKSSDVKALAMKHLDAIEEKLTALKQIKATLTGLVDSCAGDERSECPIIDAISPVEEEHKRS